MSQNLDARTLRWCARRMRFHARRMRECQDEAQSRQGRSHDVDAAYYMAKAHAYSNAASVLLLRAKVAEGTVVLKRSRKVKK